MDFALNINVFCHKSSNIVLSYSDIQDAAKVIRKGCLCSLFSFCSWSITYEDVTLSPHSAVLCFLWQIPGKQMSCDRDQIRVSPLSFVWAPGGGVWGVGTDFGVRVNSPKHYQVPGLAGWTGMVTLTVVAPRERGGVPEREWSHAGHKWLYLSCWVCRSRLWHPPTILWQYWLSKTEKWHTQVYF